jgi:molybdopterin converting factor small subunit
MTQKIKLKVELFGAFRQYTDHEYLEISLNPGSTIQDLRQTFEQALQAICPETSVGDLIAASAFADVESILDERSRFERDMTLAVLPPVCGG